MKGTQEKERLRLRDDGNYEFSTAEKNWIPAIRNVPEIDGMVPAGGKNRERAGNFQKRILRRWKR